MNLQPWLLVVHILSAMVWLGGGVLLSVLGIRARGTANATSIGDFAASLPWIGPRVLLPSMLLVLASGAWMVLINSSFAFEQLWVILALAAFAVAFLVGAAYMSRTALALDRAMKEGAAAQQLSGLLGRWIVGYLVIVALLVFTVWDMVFKPGL